MLVTIRALLLPLYLLATTLCLADGFSLPAEEKPFLDAEVAFQILANFKDKNTLRIEYAITDGYYLYRPKFKFQTSTPGYQLGEPKFPAGQIIVDDYYGEIETYRVQAIVEIPVSHSLATPSKLTLAATSQGCADAGLCYQPYTHTVELNPPSGDSTQ